MKTKLFLLTAVTAALCLSGCARYTSNEQQPSRATISPTIVTLQPGQKQQFNITILPGLLSDAVKAEKVKWSVNDIPGGNEILGTIGPDGLYRAPASVSTPCEIHICAEVEEAANKYLWATVIIGDKAPSYELIMKWSHPKGKSPYLHDPHGIALDAQGNIIITDEDKSHVVVFSPDGEFIKWVGEGNGNKPGYFHEPRVVETDTKGNIWISDVKETGPCLQAFSPKGKLIRAFAPQGTKPGQLLRAHGMGFDSKGRLFVTDVDTFRISVYDSSGKFLYAWGRRGINTAQLNAPHGLVIDPSDDVFVCNFYGPTQKFDARGNFIFDFAHADPYDGPVHFHSAAGDKWGNVYLILRIQGYDADPETKIKIAKYNNNGDFITAWTLDRPEERGNCATVDSEGNIYCIVKHERQIGVQVFAQR